MIKFKKFIKKNNFKYILLKFIVKTSILAIFFLFVLILFLPSKLFLNKKKKNKILIIRNYFQYNNKNILTYPINETIKSFLKKKNLNFQVKHFYTDNYSFFSRYLNYIKLIFYEKPSHIFFFSDYDSKNLDINYLFNIIIKFIFSCKIIAISNDGVWPVNYLRNILICYFLDGLICWPWALIGKKKIKAPLTLIIPDHLIKKKITSKKIDISFIGRNIEKRKKYIDFLEKHKIKVNKFGTISGHVLSIEKYYQILSDSKITINFSNISKKLNSLNKSHIRARLFEAVASGTLVFDEYNSQTELFFKKDIDYVPFKNKEELLLKINHYLKNYKNKGSKIAKNSLYKLRDKYSSFLFWEKFFKDVGLF